MAVLCSQSLMRERILPFFERIATGIGVLFQGVGDFVNVPLRVVNLEFKLVSGPVTVSLQSTLPVEGVSFIIGNDLAQLIQLAR